MLASSLRIMFLAAGVDSASFRFRVRQYLPYLRKYGAQADIGELAVPFASRRLLWARCADYDAVLVHRALLRSVDYWYLRHYARRYAFDVDDAVMFRDSAHRRLRSPRRLVRFRRMASGASVVIAGNSYLREWSQPAARNAVIIPTCIELNDYPVKPAAADVAIDAAAIAAEAGGLQGTPVIGWIGTRPNLMYLDIARAALSQVGRGVYKPCLRVVCDAFPAMEGITQENKIWSLTEEPTDVQGFQIGIMPLPDDAWTRGKCGLKLLQYMAAGLPTVCSPVGANAVIVQDGVTGFHARTPAEWAARLDLLLGDAALRARMGQAGRARVEAHYSVAACAPRFLDALESE